MSSGSPKRTRSERVASVELPPGGVARTFYALRRPAVLGRLMLCLVAGGCLWWVGGRGVPPFSYRVGDVPQRNVTARVKFSLPDKTATERARERAKDRILTVYDHDPQPIANIVARLKNTIRDLSAAATLDEFGADLFAQFQPPNQEGPAPTREQLETDFTALKEAVAGEEKLNKFNADLERAMAPAMQHGLLSKLPPEHRGDQRDIFVQPVGDPQRRQLVRMDEALIGDGAAIRKSLRSELGGAEVADRVFAWIHPQLPETLRVNPVATQDAINLAVAEVPDQTISYQPGDVLARALERLTDAEWNLLRQEHDAYLAERALIQTAARSAAFITVVFALFAVAGFSIFTHAQRLLSDGRRFAALLAIFVAAAATAQFLSDNRYRAELAPVLLFGMVVALAYGQEVAIVLSICLSVLVCLSIGQGLGGFVVLAGSTAVASMLCGSVRTRVKLLAVGLLAGIVAGVLTLGAGMLAERPAVSSSMLELLALSGQNVLLGVVAGFVITGILPFVERLFGVLTELSLLELGDVAHPLLQELVRRAPGTYNHSINVASLAEAAAESIGCRGLLVRVGAYFHDIGKMLKPNYFAENQNGESRHDALLPAMSTLIIVGHVKDGADLARKHRLPQPIVDFIEQHHGTTLVEYFYHRANEQSENDPDAGEVDEDAYRYPGPKPQSKEAGVLMLADAVESACRTLVEPAPARIETIVRELAMKRLMDGQFDESGLNLTELRAVQDSLIKSLIAVYHGRVRYPESRTA